jgi:hypothetical protein
MLGLSFPLPFLSIGGLDVCLDFFFFKFFFFFFFLILFLSFARKKKKGQTSRVRSTATGAGPQVNYESLDTGFHLED